ncbi:uncharacterized protein [Rutidosis leptorrhynchoides]|uniref:uncharacterized protein n=1 Tax=Rutidosis leptorrhynchoides TaxID=125765 RepID=UPI003A9A4AD8
MIRQFIVKQIGNGHSSSAWHDSWSNVWPLSSVVSSRDVYRAGWHSMSLVCDIMQTGSWPHEWLDMYPLLNSVTIPHFHDEPDRIGWKYNDDIAYSFSVSLAWNSLRARNQKVPWLSVVWYSQSIPRHAFLMWLLMGERLKTHDRMKACSYSANVWSKVRQVMLFDPSSSYDWKVIVDRLVPVSKRNIARVVVAKLCVAATVYFIWQERNKHIFKGAKRSEDKLFDVIFENVRLKILSFRFKDSTQVDRLRQIWKIDPG